MNDYSEEIQKILKKQSIEIGHRIIVEKQGTRYEGFLMPKSTGDKNTLIIKLDNGYNVGIEFKDAVVKKGKTEINMNKKPIVKKYKPDPGKPSIAILTTGGTVASKIDYKTGAVTPLSTPEEILRAVPEIGNIANIRTRIVFQMLSEDMEPDHWIILARKVADEINMGVDGIIITHGTDTMSFTSAALSFMLQDLPIPVLIVGSQRSSDRGSSDAAMNLLCAAQFITKSDFAGVAICMHESMSDNTCLIIDGLHVKKMHTSRRDAFRPIDVLPYARVDSNGTIETLRDDYRKKDKKRKIRLVDRFAKGIAIIKFHPGFDPHILEYLERVEYKGIIFEGTGLGHGPIGSSDEYTQHHAKTLEIIERMTGSGIIICMTSQSPYGKVNMNVYSDGRKLQQVGVIPLSMTTESAFVKLGWILGHIKNIEIAKNTLKENICGEFATRIDPDMFLF